MIMIVIDDQTFVVAKQGLTKALLAAKTYHGDDRAYCTYDHHATIGWNFSDFSVYSLFDLNHTTGKDPFSERINPRSLGDTSLHS